jgi:hypothetical protein
MSGNNVVGINTKTLMLLWLDTEYKVARFDTFKDKEKLKSEQKTTSH